MAANPEAVQSLLKAGGIPSLSMRPCGAVTRSSSQCIRQPIRLSPPMVRSHLAYGGRSPRPQILPSEPLCGWHTSTLLRRTVLLSPRRPPCVLIISRGTSHHLPCVDRTIIVAGPIRSRGGTEVCWCGAALRGDHRAQGGHRGVPRAASSLHSGSAIYVMCVVPLPFATDRVAPLWVEVRSLSSSDVAIRR